MIGIVIVTHGQLGQEFVHVLEHVIGPQSHLQALSICPEDEPEKDRKRILEAVKKVDTGRGTIILTDLFGGTPSNLACSLLGQSNIEIIAGVNLPLLIKLASIRANHSLKEAAQIAQDAGKKYIHLASQLLDSPSEQTANG